MSDTRTIAETFFRRARAGEFDLIAEMFADEVDWNVPGAAQVPWIGRRHTKAEAAEFFRQLPTYLQAEELSVEHLVVDGEQAVGLGNMRHRVRSTGELFASPFAFHLTVENGRITRYIAYEDSFALARAYGVIATA
ncbi:nuclear transport factor 2 family protein [Nocardia wallacei]|uniref:nuclear transport factor 2 family protein n=1 Tax=Nocardia wallacei TaxID=480035 RepID=UPI002453B2E3|nr:nuclear transport factor 2 family protein [Nocardia wallacei]